MAKPTHKAYVVTEPKEEGGKGFWNEVGVLFKHKNGNGFDLIIPQGVSISGRIVITEAKEKSEAEAA